MLRGVLPVVAGSLALGAAATPALAADCSVAALTALAVPHVTVTTASDMPAADGNPAYCDVRGSIDTGGNAAGFRIQLPATWNHKLLVYGVGGTGGSVETPSPMPSIARSRWSGATQRRHGHRTSEHSPTPTPVLPCIRMARRICRR